MQGLGTVIKEGTKVNYWTVVKSVPKPDSIKRKGKYFLCMCKCKNERVLDGASLLRGDTKSCGCFRALSNVNTKTIHGYFHHPLYKKYYGMHDRCYNINSSNYPDWGGRGIRICNEWFDDPTTFIKWGLNNGWKKGLTIERVDNNGNYTPDNCIFATRKAQSNNTRLSVKVEFNGVTFTLKQLAEKFNLNYSKLHRLYRVCNLPLLISMKRSRRWKPESLLIFLLMTKRLKQY